MTGRMGRRIALAGGIVTVIATLAFTNSAHADIWGPQGFHGYGTDTYWDNGFWDGLSNGYNRNVTGLWQAYLASYNLVGRCGLDGKFGPGTQSGTQSIQNFLGAYPDGIVGADTWDRSSRWTVYAGSNWDPTAGIQTVWRAPFASGISGDFYQNTSGGFAGYWYWAHPWASGFGLHNSSNSTLDFTPSSPC